MTPEILAANNIAKYGSGAELSSYSPGLPDRLWGYIYDRMPGDDHITRLSRADNAYNLLMNLPGVQEAAGAYYTGQGVGEAAKGVIQSEPGQAVAGAIQAGLGAATGPAAAKLAMFFPAGAKAGVIAQTLENMGHDASEIWQKTGLMKAGDGVWQRAVLPKYSGQDVVKQYKQPLTSLYDGTTLGELLDRPELFSEMPQLQNVPVGYHSGLVGTGVRGGVVAPKSGNPVIVLNPEHMFDPVDQAGTLEHEIQHLVDQQYGRALGTNDEHSVLTRKNPAYADFYNQKMREYVGMQDYPTYLQANGLQDSPKAMLDWKQSQFNGRMNMAKLRQDPRAQQNINYAIGQEWYQRSAGENNARLTQDMLVAGQPGADPTTFNYTNKVPISQQIAEKAGPEYQFEKGTPISSIPLDQIESMSKIHGTVLHASPHDFEAPSTNYMGAGEGNQSFGKGLYVAEDPNVNRYYINQFRQRNAVPEKLTITAPGSNWHSLSDLNDPDYHQERVLGHIMQEHTSMANVPENMRYGLAQSFAEHLINNKGNVDDALASFKAEHNEDTHYRMLESANPRNRYNLPPGMTVADSQRPYIEANNAKVAGVDELGDFARKNLQFNYQPPKKGYTWNYEFGMLRHPNEFLNYEQPIVDQPRIAAKAIRTSLQGLAKRSDPYAFAEAIQAHDALPAIEAVKRQVQKYDNITEAARSKYPQDSIGRTLWQRNQQNNLDRMERFKEIYDQLVGKNNLLLGHGSRYAPNDLESMKTLSDVGIPGLRYSDAFSRGSRSDRNTSNYVIFNPEQDLKLLRKYKVE